MWEEIKEEDLLSQDLVMRAASCLHYAVRILAFLRRQTCIHNDASTFQTRYLRTHDTIATTHYSWRFTKKCRALSRRETTPHACPYVRRRSRGCARGWPALKCRGRCVLRVCVCRWRCILVWTVPGTRLLIHTHKSSHPQSPHICLRTRRTRRKKKAATPARRRHHHQQQQSPSPPTPPRSGE